MVIRFPHARECVADVGLSNVKKKGRENKLLSDLRAYSVFSVVNNFTTEDTEDAQ